MLQSFKGSARDDYSIALFSQLSPSLLSHCFRFVQVLSLDRFFILDLVQFFFVVVFLNIDFLSSDGLKCLSSGIM